ncbi:UNKNOWN [Stylonychia lemnae]|uniref:Morn repeat protein n=1 Tax=Stylonychia lemnae TaxID=5949 RepID=A0A078BBJ1_STYLE|nr:UNKNOWN [Stylonychia lemnae]|eukprot:CDW91581.1 UNKNOWN [Stylonychia lemnae]
MESKKAQPHRFLNQYDQLLTLIKSQKVKAVEFEVKKAFNSDNFLRKQHLCKDFLDIMTKMVKIVGMKDIQNLIKMNSDIFEQPIEEQLVDEINDPEGQSIFNILLDEQQFQFEVDPNVDLSTFVLTLNSSNPIVNETLTKLEEFNYSHCKLEHNPNRIFLSIFEGDDDCKFQGEYDIVTKQIEGRCRQIFDDGSIFDGLWKNNKSNGIGQIVFADGGYYIGECIDDESHGYGKYYNSEDKSLYEGQFVLHYLQGIGKMNYSDDSMYYGLWENGERSNYGVYVNPDGDIELGQWNQNQRNGFQMQITKEGQIKIRKYENDEIKETLFENEKKDDLLEKINDNEIEQIQFRTLI